MVTGRETARQNKQNNDLDNSETTKNQETAMERLIIIYGTN